MASQGRARAFVVGLGLAGGLATSASASTYTVNPVRVSLTPAAPSQLVNILNETDRPLSFQISAYRWSMDEAGQSSMMPTEEIVWFPRLLTIEPHGERKLRVGTTAPFAATEQSYRLIVEELPGAASARQGPAIRLLTKMSLPVFLSPAKAAPVVRLDGAYVGGGRLAFAVANDGNAHAAPQGVRISGRAQDGSEAFARQLEAWYILAGNRRRYEVELPREACVRLFELTIQVQDDEAPVTQAVPVAPSACGP